MTTCSTGPCWTASNLTIPDFQVQSVGVGAGKWLVGGVNPNNGNARLQYSSDGINWNLVDFGYLSGYAVRKFATGNGLIMGMVNAAQHVLSSDGINWSVINHFPPVSGDQSLAFGGGYFVFRSSDSLAYSSDGVVWNETYSNFSGGYMDRSMAYGNGLYVGVGSSGFCYTNDVATPLTLTPYSTNQASHIAYGNGAFVVIEQGLGSTNTVYRSTDGINWTTITDALPTPFGSFQVYWDALVFSQDRFLICKIDSNELAYSIDGITWTLTTGDSLFDSGSGNGQFYMTTDDSGQYMAANPFSNATQVGVCPCAVPGDWWVKLSGVTLSGVSIGT
jgi:hypothetical protein